MVNQPCKAILILALVGPLSACKTRPTEDLSNVEAADSSANNLLRCQRPTGPSDYNSLFCISRMLLTRSDVKAFNREVFKEALVIPPQMIQELRDLGLNDSRLKDLSETQFVQLLMNNSNSYEKIFRFIDAADKTPNSENDPAFRKKWGEMFKADLKGMSLLQSLNDPLQPFELLVSQNGHDIINNQGEHLPGFRNLKLVVSHAYQHKNRVVVPAGNLKAEWISFINQAQKEIALNIFDFDLQDVAQALIVKARTGKSVRVGIDAGVAGPGGRKKVAAIFAMLQAGGVKVFAVRSTGLNHQKMAASDWSIPGKGRVLLSSGNLTRSCSDPGGDLADQPESVRKRFESIPNANNLITMDSDILAALVNSELTKTLDMGLVGRGNNTATTKTYPLSGVFKIYGPRKPTDLVQPFIMIAFSPGGGLKNMNAMFLSRIIEHSDLRNGPMRLAQFAFAAPQISQALLRKAKAELQSGRPFDFLAVGDTSFAMRDFSQFLALSDIQPIEAEVIGPSGKKMMKIQRYNALTTGPWEQTLKSPSALNSLRSNVRIAPRRYRNHNEVVNGTSTLVNAKIHHKLYVGGSIATLATSFNFSDSAETNNEQVVAIVDQNIADDARGIVEALANDLEGTRTSTPSVLSESQRRNKILSTGTDPDPEPDSDGGDDTPVRAALRVVDKTVRKGDL